MSKRHDAVFDDVLKGLDAGAYYVDGPGGYYLDGDEPPGQWLGLGAEALGLAGEVVDDDFLLLFNADGNDSEFTLPTDHPGRWTVALSTAGDHTESDERILSEGDRTTLPGRSLLVLLAAGQE